MGHIAITITRRNGDGKIETRDVQIDGVLGATNLLTDPKIIHVPSGLREHFLDRQNSGDTLACVHLKHSSAEQGETVLIPPVSVGMLQAQQSHLTCR